MKKKIAITGGIGSGKSVVSQIIKENGYPVFSCDEIYKELLSSQSYVEKIKSRFPTVIKQGKIDKNILGNIVFNDKNSREDLNQIAHPLIMDRLLQNMEKVEGNLIFAEVPLLFEGNFMELFDRILVVQRDLNQRIEAIKKRDGITDEFALAKIRSQFDYDSEEGKEKLKNEKVFLLQNESSIVNLKKAVDSFLDYVNVKLFS